MARPWRIQYLEAIYHIMSREVNSGNIFSNSDDYIKVLSSLEKNSGKIQNIVKDFVVYEGTDNNNCLYLLFFAIFRGITAL